VRGACSAVWGNGDKARIEEEEEEEEEEVVVEPIRGFDSYYHLPSSR
jgi:hypothetical protein